MALDGMFLSCIKKEIEDAALGSRVDKIYQPSREELILTLRSKTGLYRLLLSARANSPRVHFTEISPENPACPPMLCMLLRKHLTGAVLTGIRQIGFDRILFFDFDATNEIGDKVNLSLCIEIMAQYSNIILINGNNMIIDALKRVDFTKSSVREVLPGLPYCLPPSQDKLNIFNSTTDEITERICSNKQKLLSSSVLDSVQGVSPLLCREIAYRTCSDDIRISELSDTQIIALKKQVDNIRKTLIYNRTAPVILIENKKPFDFSFINIKQYGSAAEVIECDNFSHLLDKYYCEKDNAERISKLSQDLRKTLSNAVERTIKKIDLQRIDLEKCSDREQLRVYAELINANQYALKKGSLYYDVENYYDKNSILRVPADPALSPMQNSQKYYKEYKKTYTAEKKLQEMIEKGEDELVYIKSVLDELSRVDSERGLNEIRQELYESGYIKSAKSGKGKKLPPALPPIEFLSSDGFRILVGRNNIQNDKLSLKTSDKNDLWLHTKNIPGAHVIICGEQKDISETAVMEAAIIAAYHSEARDSSQVPVDYTKVKNLKKPNGAKPGKVIYYTYNTLYVTPEKEMVEKLKV